MKNFSIKDEALNENNITKEVAIDLLEKQVTHMPYKLLQLKRKVHLKKGPYGHYLQFYLKKKKKNFPFQRVLMLKQ